MSRKTDRKTYLNKSADILCKAAYELCRDSCKKGGSQPADAKGLKEICAAVKETIGISESLGKNEQTGSAFAVVMDSAATEYSE